MRSNIDLTGMRFNNFTVLRQSETKKYQNIGWACQCDCGTIKIMSGSELRQRKATGCRCNLKMIRHYTSRTRLYRIHVDMIRRCTQPQNKSYKYYGARGIKVCNEWLGNEGYIRFRDWALKNGYKDNLTIDRINVDSDYSPQNCRWVTTKVQNNNTRANKLLSLGEETHNVAEWAEILGIKRETIGSRLMRGWDDKSTLTKPVRKMRDWRHKQ